MSRLAAEPIARRGVTGGCGEVVEKKESDVRECLKYSGPTVVTLV